ncbi:hypothetical protein BH09CHL1_BH09CHL1_32260 [soil metagenome]
MALTVTDFGNSYMSWSIEADLNDKRVPGHMPWGNSARILIDARCTLFDDANGTSLETYLIAPCRTEWMYRENDLIQIPSGEYRVIFSQDRQISVGKHIDELSARSGSIPTSAFTSLEFAIRPAPAAALDSDQAIVDATLALKPIVATTEIVNAERGLRAVLEYPIRTMNIHPERVRFQVDTGPIVFPDFSLQTEHLIDHCKLAHTVFNTFDYAEFICKQPTPLIKDGAEITKVYHYSDVHRLNATSRFFAIEV